MRRCRTRVSRPGDCPCLRAAKASRLADVRRLRQPLGTCRRISISSPPEVARQPRRMDGFQLGTAAKRRGPEMAARVSTAHTSAPAKDRTRVAMRTRVRRRERETRRSLARVAAAATAGRDFRQCPRARLLSLDWAGPVNRPAAAKSGVRTGLRAVPLRQAVATDQVVTDQAATAGLLVPHSI